MKRIHSILFFLILGFETLNAQCVLVPLSLQERIQNATLIIEAQVQDQHCFWANNQQMILTAHTLQVSKLYNIQQYQH